MISSFESCDKLSCTSARSVGCVDFVSEEPYCQCAGGFSAQACRISVPEDEETSESSITCFKLVSLHTRRERVVVYVFFFVYHPK